VAETEEGIMLVTTEDLEFSELYQLLNEFSAAKRRVICKSSRELACQQPFSLRIAPCANFSSRRRQPGMDEPFFNARRLPLEQERQLVFEINRRRRNPM